MRICNKATMSFLIIAGMLQGCIKDTGNYNYSVVNEAIVTGIDKMYTIRQGEVLSIKPTISYTKDLVGDTNNYVYGWYEIRRQGFNSRIPILKGSNTALNESITGSLGLGAYDYAFRITDKKTEVWKEFNFTVLITNAVYEGWLALSETQEKQSRLDMLSYQPSTNSYEFIPDVLAFMKSTVPLKGAPSFIDFTYNKICIGTDQMASSINSTTLSYQPTMDFSQNVETGVNVAIGTGSKLSGGASQCYLWANNMMYTSNIAKYYDINKMSTGDISSFKVAPFLAFNPQVYGAILFNETNSEFVWYPGSTARACLKLENESLFKNKIDKHLLFMKYVKYNGGEYFAILKDKVGDKVYLARFTIGKQNYFEEITNTEISQANHFEVSPDFGYVFYTVGNKLYEYDFNTKVNKEMVDYGSRKISLLHFQIYHNVGHVNEARNTEITQKLCVGTYEESDLNSSGILDIYSVPPINGMLIKASSYSGMGKIKSLTYRFR